MSGPGDIGRSYARERELIEAHNIDAAIRMFINRYAPKDGPRDFEADLIQIVQRIYREAQAPYVQALSDTLARTPMPPIVVATQPTGASNE